MYWVYSFIAHGHEMCETHGSTVYTDGRVLGENFNLCVSGFLGCIPKCMMLATV